MNSIGVGGPASVNLQNIQSLDMDKALLTVQYGRASKLEDQLMSVIKDVNAKNETTGQLLQASASLISILGTINGASRSHEEKLTDVQSAACRAVQHSVGGNVGIHLPESGVLTVGHLTYAIEVIKNTVDALSSSQQMDMFRLQSLTNKRNEALESMSSIIKKTQDDRSSLLGQIR